MSIGIHGFRNGTQILAKDCEKNNIILCSNRGLLKTRNSVKNTCYFYHQKSNYSKCCENDTCESDLSEKREIKEIVIKNNILIKDIPKKDIKKNETIYKENSEFKEDKQNEQVYEIPSNIDFEKTKMNALVGVYSHVNSPIMKAFFTVLIYPKEVCSAISIAYDLTEKAVDFVSEKISDIFLSQ